jgi:hypothetical protein
MGIAFLACSPTHTDTSSSVDQAKAVIPLYATRVVRTFSDTARQDTLSVCVNGESILTGRPNLRIVDYQGKLLYASTFPTQALLDREGIIKPEEDEQVIKNRIDNFFEPEHFAVLSQANDSMKMAWKGVPVDPAAVCFSFPVSKNSLRQVAYSKSRQKVVQVTSALPNNKRP